MWSVLIGLFAVSGWVLYFRERSRSRDYVTDLMQLVHDHDVGLDELRRSRDWKEVKRSVPSNGGGGT